MYYIVSYHENLASFAKYIFKGKTMLNLTIDGQPITVSGKQLQVGDTAPNFVGTLPTLKSWSLDSVSGIKVISAIPSLDTGICQIQTKRFNKEMMKLEGVTLITVSLDLPFAQSRWCGAEGLQDLIVISDYQGRDFALKYSLLIDQLKLLTRAVLVLDKDNVVRCIDCPQEVQTEPDYKIVLETVTSLLG